MNAKAKKICDAHWDVGCRAVCPLAIPCVMQAGDDLEIFGKRMNEAAEKLEDK